VKEVLDTDPDIWRPNSLAEWSSYQRLQAVLPVWVEQAKTDCADRRSLSRLIFGLLYIEVFAAIGLMIGIGLKYFDISTDLLKILFPSLFAQVVGLAYIVVRNLFGTREDLQNLLGDRDTRHGRGPRRPNADRAGSETGNYEEVSVSQPASSTEQRHQ
jgi:hypothetical protein